jgi:phage FluMu protein Com
MGDRYYIKINCPHCGYKEKELQFYAPTCGFITWKCPKCGEIVNLEKYTGIDAESCATTDSGVKTVRELKKSLKWKD